MINAGIVGCCEEEGAVSVTGVTFTNDLPASANTDQDKYILTWDVLPANAADKGVTFQSSDNSVLSPNSSGQVTYNGAGTANVTVTTDDGGFTDTTRNCSVTIGPCESAPNPTISNPSFTSTSDWSLSSSYVTISSGSLRFNDTFTGLATNATVANLKVGCRYTASMTITSLSSGELGMEVAGVGYRYITSTGTKSVSFTASSTTTSFHIFVTDSFNEDPGPTLPYSASEFEEYNPEEDGVKPTASERTNAIVSQVSITKA